MMHTDQQEITCSAVSRFPGCTEKYKPAAEVGDRMCSQQLSLVMCNKSNFKVTIVFMCTLSSAAGIMFEILTGYEYKGNTGGYLPGIARRTNEYDVGISLSYCIHLVLPFTKQAIHCVLPAHSSKVD